MDRPGEGAKKANQALEDLEEAINKLELYKVSFTFVIRSRIWQAGNAVCQLEHSMKI